MFLIISGTTWQHVHGPEPLPWFSELTGAYRLQPIPLTPRARLWLHDHQPATHDYGNALASALTVLFGCQTGPVFGPACLTSHHREYGARGLDPAQTTAFTQVLTALTNPTTLSRHRMACRLAASWHSPDTEETGRCS